MRKGMTMSLNVIITIVVLLIVASAILVIVGSSTGIFGANSENSITDSSESILCQTQLAAACVHIKSGEPCTPATACDSCPASTKCP